MVPRSATSATDITLAATGMSDANSMSGAASGRSGVPGEDRTETPPPAGEVRRVAAALRRLAPAEWPHSHPQAALAVLDAVHSVNCNHATTVRPLIGRYCDFRRAGGADPRRDTAVDLRDVIVQAGGPDVFAAEVLANRQLTSTSNGIPKSEACLRLAELLVDHGVSSVAALRRRQRSRAGLEEVARAWRAVPGQRSGRTWRWFLMMTGVPGPRVDVEIRHWVSGVLGRVVGPGEAADLLGAATSRTRLAPAQVDRRVSLDIAERKGSRRTAAPAVDGT